MQSLKVERFFNINKSRHNRSYWRLL